MLPAIIGPKLGHIARHVTIIKSSRAGMIHYPLPVEYLDSPRRGLLTGLSDTSKQHVQGRTVFHFSPDFDLTPHLNMTGLGGLFSVDLAAAQGQRNYERFGSIDCSFKGCKLAKQSTVSLRAKERILHSPASSQ